MLNPLDAVKVLNGRNLPFFQKFGISQVFYQYCSVNIKNTNITPAVFSFLCRHLVMLELIFMNSQFPFSSSDKIEMIE